MAAGPGAAKAADMEPNYRKGGRGMAKGAIKGLAATRKSSRKKRHGKRS